VGTILFLDLDPGSDANRFSNYFNSIAEYLSSLSVSGCPPRPYDPGGVVNQRSLATSPYHYHSMISVVIAGYNNQEDLIYAIFLAREFLNSRFQ
jgi:hypothetical protein